MKNRIIVIITSLILSLQAYCEEAFITTITGKTYFGELVETSDPDKVAISFDGIVTYLKKTDILTIEKEEGGVIYNNKEKLVEETNHPDPPYGKGCKVYIPFSSDKIAARAGAREVRLSLMKSKLWEVVSYPEAADFILQFAYNKDKDKACLVFMDRNNEEIFRTKWIKCDGWFPAAFGADTGDKLVNKILPRFLKEKGIQ